MKELEILQSIGKLILSLLDLDELLTRIVEAGVDITGAEEGYLLLVDEGTGELYLRAGQNLGEERAQGFRLKVHDSTAGSVVKTGKPVIAESKEGKSLKIKTGYQVKSLLNVPLKVREKVIGVLGVNNKQSDKAFSKDNLHMLSILADYAAIAIENAQLFDDAKQRARNLETLQNLALTVSSSLDLDETLRKVCQAAVEFFNADHSGLVLFDRSYVEGMVKAEYPALGTLGTTIPLRGVPAEERLIEAKEPLSISDVAGDESWGPIRDILGKFDIRSMLIVPVVFKGRMLGSFSLDTIGHLRTFTENEVNLCKIFAAQVAVAIENARLYGSMERQAERLAVLYEIVREMTSALELDRILGSIAEHIVRLVGARRSLFLLVDKKRGHLIKATGYGFPPEHLQGLTFQEVEAGVSGWVLRTGKPTLVADAQSDPRNIGIALERAKQFDTVPLIVAPLVVKGEVVGTLTAANTADDPPFTEGDLNIVVMLANQASVAIESARLFSQLSETKERLNDLIVSSLDAVIAIDEDKKITVFNRRAEEMFGWTAKEMEGRNVARLYADFGKAQEIYEVLNREGTIADWEILLRHKDGTGISALLSATLIRDSQGNPIGQVGFIRDLRQVNLLEERLRALMQVSQAITGTLELDKVLDLIVASTVAAFPTAQSGVIHLYDERTDTLRIWATTLGYSAEALEALHLRVGEGIAGWVFQNRQPLVVNDTGQDPRYKRIGHPEVQVHRSMICVPLRAREQVIGTLSLNNSDIIGAFQPEDLGLLASFADQAAIAIDNARLMAQMQRTRETAGVIAGVTLQEDLEQTLKTIAQHAQRVLRSDAISLYSYDEATGKFGEWATEIVDARDPDSARRPEKLDPDSAIGTILRLEGPQYYHLAEDHADQDRLLAGSFVHVEDIKTVIGVQLRVGERKVGVMFVNFRSPHRFTSDEIAAIQLFADQAAVAIENARLYERQQQEAEQLAVINQIAAEISSSLDFGKILQTLASELARIIGVEQCGIALFDERGEYGDIVAEYLEAGGVAATGLRIPLRDNPTIEIVRKTKRPLAMKDAQHDPRMEKVWDIMKRRRTQSIMIVPIVIGDRVIGTIGLDAVSGPREFTREEEWLAETIAHHAAIAIQNAQRYEELRHTKGLVGARTALAWMGMASSTWRHAMEGHALTIREQAHLLRTDLQRSLLGGDYARIDQRLDIIERLTTRILEKPIIPPLSAEEGVAQVVVNELIGERARQLWQNEPYKSANLRLHLGLDKAATVRTSPEWLRRAFDVLVDNAVEAVADCEVQEITIGTREARGDAEIIVSDTGPGMPREVMSKLFSEPIQKPEEAKGLGMGLLMAKAIVQTYGGDIWVESTGPTGTAMVIWLPLSA